MKKFFNNNIEKSRFDAHIKREGTKHGRIGKLNSTKARIKRREDAGEIENILNVYNDAKSILCIGCRHDSEVEMFEKNGLNAFGIDINIETKKIKKIPAEKIDSIFNENSYDVAYSSHSLEHVIHPEKVLENIRNISNLGCYVILPFEARNAPGQDHTVIFDISKLPKNCSHDDVILNIKNDFKTFEPYTVEYINVKDDEIHIAFRWN